MSGRGSLKSIPLLCQRFWTSPTLLVFLFVLVIPSAFTHEHREQSISRFQGLGVSALGHLQCPEEVIEEVVAESDSENDQKILTEGPGSFACDQLLFVLLENLVTPKALMEELFLDLARSSYLANAITALQGTRAPPRA